MSDQSSEADFEDRVVELLAESGWESGDTAGWDMNIALAPSRVLSFIEDTQPAEWKRMKALHGDALPGMLTEQIVRELDLKGTLDILRRGFRFQGRTLQVAAFRPAHGLNPETKALYDRNVLTVTEQALCHPGKQHKLDLLFDVNGIPVATCELKNPSSGQTWKSAVNQYKRDRDPNAPLFRSTKRALVHFAADPNEIHMTTKLAGDNTVFLPFNRGSHPGEVICGAGNPEDPRSGYRTYYFWREVLERHQFLRILRSYVFVERREVKVVDGEGKSRTETRKNLIFPRYHQLDAVTRLLDTARDHGPGVNYLIQHSAGSGKTNSISWLAHQLSTLHNDADTKVFDCVVVVTDRRVLDSQLQDAIYQIDHTQGVVAAIDKDSRQLARALTDGTMIVVTTLQKFPWVMRGLLAAVGSLDPDDASETEHSEATKLAKQIGDRKYAVIVDEAHSSQSGEAAREMKAILGSRSHAARNEAEDGGGWEDGLNAVVESRGTQPNLSFFAFTATPKGKTIELFGWRDDFDEPRRAFHVYSMRQAIEEGFILDVLSNYTDYDTYYKLIHDAEDDPDVPQRKTARKLARFVSLHPHNLAQKTEVIVEHFRTHVKHRIEGQAKAMVVTSSRKHAVRYKQTFDRYLEEHGCDDIRTLVAFSGTVVDDGISFTEPSMNIDIVSGKPISEAALADRFASPDYHVLLVAEKYQTGFDQPLLQAMYVDKPLKGLHAVQTLSRLNRRADGKVAPFVLDFVNDRETIREAFAPYYDQTDLLAESDPYRLNVLRHELDQAQVYHQSEVEDFARVFFMPNMKMSERHEEMQRIIGPAAARFYNDLEDVEARDDFRSRLSAFVRLYAFLSQIIPYADSELERLSAFGRALLGAIKTDADDDIDLAGDVDLEAYRLQQMSSGAIDLSDDEGDSGVFPPMDAGNGSDEDELAPLSEVIERLNARFGTEFAESERLFLEQVREDAANDDEVCKSALANRYGDFKLAVSEQFAKIMVDRLSDNNEFVNRCLGDDDFKQIIFDGLADELFKAIRGADAG